jgi:hypothetical protein
LGADRLFLAMILNRKKIWQQYEKYAEDALSRPTLVAIIKMREKLMGSAAGLRHTFSSLFLPLSNSVYPGSDFFHPGSRIRIFPYRIPDPHQRI